MKSHYLYPTVVGITAILLLIVLMGCEENLVMHETPKQAQLDGVTTIHSMSGDNDIYVTEDMFRVSGGGFVAWSDETAAVGDWSVKLVHDFSEGGFSRVLLERTEEPFMIFGDIEEWSYWVKLMNDNNAFCPTLTFYLDAGDPYSYYPGTNVNVILNISKRRIDVYNWEKISSGDTWRTNDIGAMLNTSSHGWGPVSYGGWNDPLTWDAIRSEEIKYGFGASPPTINLSDAGVVGILIGYPGQLGSNQTVTAYLDDFSLNDVTYVFEALPANPTTIDDCKKGGWQKYGFRNQGLCIQFVNTGRDSR